MRKKFDWFGSAGYYSITDFPHELPTMASIEHVGENGPYRAYHIRPLDTLTKPPFFLSRQVEYRLRNMRSAKQLQREIAELKNAMLISQQEVANLNNAMLASQQKVANLQHALHSLQQSRSWRWTAPIRRVISLLHQRVSRINDSRR
jgi:hypothetical protein